MAVSNPTPLHPHTPEPDAFDGLIEADRVHRSLYTDQALFEQEMNRVFGGTWTFLAHETEIPKKNDFVRKRLGFRPIIVTRDNKGEFNALLNRCAHRGATVCRLAEGNARRFTCPYHSWNYDNKGNLVGVPMEAGFGPNFDKSEHGLGKLRVESYRGFIFGTLNPELADLETHLGYAAELIDQWLDRWPGAELKVRHSQHRLICNGNWKLVYDNAADGYHPAFSHASLLRMRKDRYGGGVDMQWTIGDVDDGRQTVSDIGNGNTFIDQRAEIERYWDQAAPMPGEDSYAKILRAKLGDKAEAALDLVMGSGMNLNVFPNLLIIGNQIQVMEPQAVDCTHLNWYATSLEADDMPPEANALRMRLQEDFPSFGEPDDLANFEECQDGLKNAPEMEWVLIGRHMETEREWTDEHGNVIGPVTDELPMRAFWREWKKRMTSNVLQVGS